MQPNELLGLALSVVTIALFIIALILFINYGGSAKFYVVVIAALVIGVLNAWIISKEGRRRSAPRAAAPRKRRGARRGSRR